MKSKLCLLILAAGIGAGAQEVRLVLPSPPPDISEESTPQAESQKMNKKVNIPFSPKDRRGGNKGSAVTPNGAGDAD